MKLRRVGITVEALGALPLANNFKFVCALGIPKDAILVRFYLDVDRDMVWLVYSHESFSSVADGDTIPVAEVEFTYVP